MRKWLNKYFIMSRAEFNGLIMLWILIIIVTLAPATFSWFFPEKRLEADPHIVEGLKERSRNLRNWKARKSYSRLTVVNDPFDFDPNTLSISGWQRLGLSEKQAASIQHYRDRGGRFRTLQDVAKMYTISPALFSRIAPYIHITASVVESVKIHSESKVREMKVFEINSADTISMLEVSGIGPTFARRIFKYRERLGGFNRKIQLLEVYDLDSTKYAEIQGQFSIDVSLIRKIAINKVTLDALRNHPYLRYKEASAIIQYRKQHGNYVNIADLTKVVLLSAETVDKLAPYLSFEL